MLKSQVLISCLRAHVARAGSHAAQQGCVAGLSSSTQSAQDVSQEDEELKAAVREALRKCQVAQAAAAGYFEGQCLPSSVRGGGVPRVDLQYFRDKEAERLQAVQELMPQYRTRPALAQGLLRAAGAVLGAAAAVAPPRIGLAVSGAVQDALADHFNDQLRELRELEAEAKEARDEAQWEEQQRQWEQQQQQQGAGMAAAGSEASTSSSNASGSSFSGQAEPQHTAQLPEDVRRMILELRDADRAPDGAPIPPDVVKLTQTGVAGLGVEGAVGAIVKAAARFTLDLASRT